MAIPPSLSSRSFAPPTSPHDVAAGITASYLGPEEEDLFPKTDMVSYFLSPSASNKSFPSPLPHHRAARIVAGYLGRGEQDLPLKTDVASIFFTIADETSKKNMPPLADRYAFRTARVWRILRATGLDTVIMGKGDAAFPEQWVWRNITLSICRDMIGHIFFDTKIKALMTTYVSVDGMGDYTHVLWAGEHMQKSFPKSEASLGVAAMDLSERRQKFPPCELPRFLWDAHGSHSSPEDIDQLRQCKAATTTSHFVFDISNKGLVNRVVAKPPAYVMMEEDIRYDRVVEFAGNRAHLPGESYYYSGSHRGYQNLHMYAMGPGPFSMGLPQKTLFGKEADITALAKILEKGGPKALAAALREGGMSDLRDPRLKTVLLDPSLLPKERGPNAGYRETHDLHYCYMPDKLRKDINGFVLTSLACDRASTKPVIDIIFPHRFPTEKEAASYFKWLRKHRVFENIKEVEIIQKEGDGLTIYKSGQLREGGKLLRLINPFGIDNIDVLRLIANSGKPIGCTGDSSLSEVSFLGGIPYYGGQSQSLGVLSDFVELARDFFRSGDSPLVRYLSHLRQTKSDWYSIEEGHKEQHTDEDLEEIARLVHEERFAKEISLFSDHLNQYYNFNEVFTDIIIRQLARTQIPSFQGNEMRLLADITAGRKTFQECYEEFRNGLATVRFVSKKT